MKKPGLKTGYGQQILDQINELTKEIEHSKKNHQAETATLKDLLKIMEEKLESFERRYSNLDHLQHEQTVVAQQQQHHPQNLSFQPGESMAITSAIITSRDEEPQIFTTNDAANVTGIPPLDKTLALVEVYFGFINPLFPILHPVLDRPLVLKNVNSSNLLLLGVIVSSLKYGAHMFSPEEVEMYFNNIKLMIISSCYSVKNTKELKVITLLAISLYSRANNYEAWSMVSLAVGGCLHLGLVKDPLSRSEELDLSDDEFSNDTGITPGEWENWVEKESLRNLFWEIFKLDKLSSMGSHVAAKLPVSEITCLFPLRSDYWALKHIFNKEMIERGQTKTLDNDNSNPLIHEDLYGSNSYIIHVLNLMGKCLSFRRSPLDIQDMRGLLSWQLSCYEFESKIQQWKKGLPIAVSKFLDLSSFISIKPTTDFVILHALYHTLVIRLHSPSAFSHSQEKSAIPAQTSKSNCLNSAYLILKMSESCSFFFQADGECVHGLFGPYYAFAIWVSGRVLLVNSIHTLGQLDGEFDYAVSLLRKIGKKWECATKYADILEFVKDDSMQMDSASNASGPGDNRSPTGSFSDDARLITNLKLNASSLDSLLLKKVARFKASKGIDDGLLVFDWFKLPIHDTFMP